MAIDGAANQNIGVLRTKFGISHRRRIDEQRKGIRLRSHRDLALEARARRRDQIAYGSRPAGVGIGLVAVADVAREIIFDRSRLLFLLDAGGRRPDDRWNLLGLGYGFELLCDVR